MRDRLKALAPLTISVGLLAFLWTDFVLNFSLHWFTVKDHVLGAMGLPRVATIVLPASFIGWGLFFALGATTQAARRTMIAAVTGTLGAGILIAAGSATAHAPDFYGLALWAGITSIGILVLSTTVADDRFAPAPAFVCYATTFAWWIATGLDNFVPGGKGPHTVSALISATTHKPMAAGTGASGGLLSTPWQWVVINVLVSIVLGSLLGIVSVKLAAAIAKLRLPVRLAQPAPQAEGGVAR